jgi:electron transport complex protein RnfB
MAKKEHQRPDALTPRRRFLKYTGLGAAAVVLGGAAGALVGRKRVDPRGRGTVWQIDPGKCNQCGECATLCVREVSAVKATHHFPICGYCDLCFGYFLPQPNSQETGAENLQCPTGALKRRHVEGTYFEYLVDLALCNGCGKCAAGCGRFGNGSLYLQVRHDFCLHCNECRIAAGCPADAFVRISLDAADGYRHNPRL